MRWMPKFIRGLFGDRQDPIVEMSKTRTETLESMLARIRVERRERKLRQDIHRLQTIREARRGT